jgi:hypothetical protein
VTDEVGDRVPEADIRSVIEEQVQEPEQRVDQRRQQRADSADERFRPGGPQRRDEEQHARDDQAATSSEVVSHHAAERGADEATPQRASDREAFETETGAFGKAERRDEIYLDRLDRAGDHRRVVAEQQSAERRDDRQDDEKAGMGARGGHGARGLRHAISLTGLCF